MVGVTVLVCLSVLLHLIQVLSILDTLESVWNRGDIQSVVMEHEALNVVIR